MPRRGISAGTLRETTNLRYAIGVLCFVALLFTLVAMGAHRGWAEGAVTLRSARETPLAPAACPDDLTSRDPGAVCVAAQTVLATVKTTLAYGLFRDLVYASTADVETTTSLYQQVEAADGNGTTTRFIDASVEYSEEADTIVQKSYRLWGQGNPDAIANVTGAQAFLVMGFWLTFFAWILLVVGLHGTPSKRKAEARTKLSHYLLLAAAASLFLSYSVWAGVSTRALTNVCTADDEANPGTVVCTQLLSTPCQALLAQDPTALCTTTADVNKRAGIWGLVFATWVVLLVLCFCWGRLHEQIVRLNAETTGLTPHDDDDTTSSSSITSRRSGLRVPILGDLDRGEEATTPPTRPTAQVV